MEYCQCGRKHIETSSSNPYQTTVSDNYGNIIFAICWHGFVVIDEMNKQENIAEEVE
jgi:hypothetical protein